MGELIKYVAGVFGAATLAVVFVAYFGHKLTELLISRDLEGFKLSLAHDLTMEVERLKSEMAVDAARQQTTFVRLHERRIEIVAALYSRIATMHAVARQVSTAVGNTKITGVDTVQALSRTLDDYIPALNTLLDYWDAHQIWFPASLREKMDELTDLLSFPVRLLQMGTENASAKTFDEKLAAAKPEMEHVRRLLAEVRRGLDQEFAVLLGVEDGT